MRVKAINRSETECARERRQDLQKVHKNLDPALHPFEKAVEYTRALNAAKLDRRALRCRCLGRRLLMSARLVSGKGVESLADSGWPAGSLRSRLWQPSRTMTG